MLVTPGWSGYIFAVICFYPRRFGNGVNGYDNVVYHHDRLTAHG